MAAATGAAALAFGCGERSDTTTDSVTPGGAAAGSTSAGGANPAGAGGSSGNAGGAPSNTGGASGNAGGASGSPGLFCLCKPGEVRCGQPSGSTLYRCVEADNGCKEEAIPCEPGTICDPILGACMPPLPSTCQAGVACVNEEWCGVAPGEPDQDKFCSCSLADSPGKLSCNLPNPLIQTPSIKVCYDPQGQPMCLPFSDLNLADALRQRAGFNGCVESGPASELTSGGEPRCCYQFGDCPYVGRPLVVSGQPRAGALWQRAAWG